MTTSAPSLKCCASAEVEIRVVNAIRVRYLQQPATSNQQPATSNQQPATSNQQPATSNQQPATSNQQPVIRQTSARQPSFRTVRLKSARFDAVDRRRPRSRLGWRR